MSFEEENEDYKIDDSLVAKAITDKTRTFFVSTMGRLGFQTFCGFVEYTWFHPRFGPNSNDDFHYYAIHFGMPHFMISIPRRYEKRAVEIARRLKLKPLLGLVPMLIEAGGAKQFPGAKEAAQGRPNLYVVESEDRTIYNNDRDLNRLILDREREIIDLMVEKGPVLTPKQAADRLWRRD